MMLIAANADVDLADDTGATPLRIARKRARPIRQPLIGATRTWTSPTTAANRRWSRLQAGRRHVACTRRSSHYRGNADAAAADAWLTNRIGRMARMTRGHRHGPRLQEWPRTGRRGCSMRLKKGKGDTVAHADANCLQFGRRGCAGSLHVRRQPDEPRRRQLEQLAACHGGRHRHLLRPSAHRRRASPEPRLVAAAPPRGAHRRSRARSCATRPTSSTPPRVPAARRRSIARRSCARRAAPTPARRRTSSSRRVRRGAARRTSTTRRRRANGPRS